MSGAWSAIQPTAGSGRKGCPGRIPIWAAAAAKGRASSTPSPAERSPKRTSWLKLEGDPEHWRGLFAGLVQQGLVAEVKGSYRLTFPVLRRGDSDVLLPVVDALMKPIVAEIAEPAFAEIEAQLDQFGYGHARDQYAQWHVWLSGNVVAEALRFLMEQGALPRPPDPAPANFGLLGWEPDLPLMEWSFGN